MPYLETMMRGVTNLRNTLSDYLSTSMPPAIDLMRTQNNLTPKQLPYPEKYDSADPTMSDVYPYIGAYATGISGFTRTDLRSTGSIEYDPTYEVTLFVSTRTANLGVGEDGLPKWEQPYRESAIRQRDDLVSILLGCLLIKPTLGTKGTSAEVLVEEDSIRVSLPDPIKHLNDSNPVWICSGIVVLDIRMTEVVVSPYIANANTIQTEFDTMV